jgi:hypothetical protein
MAIKFEKVTVGMTLYDRHTYQMGNTKVRTLGEWHVRVLEIDTARHSALISWNGNAPTWWGKRRICALHTWSMHDTAVAVVEKSAVMGSILRCRKLTKAEIAALRANSPVDNALSTLLSFSIANDSDPDCCSPRYSGLLRATDRRRSPACVHGC